MKERPILFKGEMVRAILEGRKTQTRRVIKNNPLIDADFTDEFIKLPENHIVDDCPYGKVGDRLWVRETFFHEETSDEYGDGVVVGPLYRADMPMHWDAIDTEHGDDVDLVASDYKWTPSIHMPRWASRINLEVVSKKAERVQEISEDDAMAEGMLVSTVVEMADGSPCYSSPFYDLWTQTYGIDNPKSLESNPWVWVVEFKRI